MSCASVRTLLLNEKAESVVVYILIKEIIFTPFMFTEKQEREEASLPAYPRRRLNISIKKKRKKSPHPARKLQNRLVFESVAALDFLSANSEASNRALLLIRCVPVCVCVCFASV